MLTYKKSQGFTYLGLLIFIAIIGIASIAVVRVTSLMQQRDAEEELLFIGSQFRAAFSSYYNANVPGTSHYPGSLQDLIKDPRFPQPIRHLRKIYIDPITNKADWVIIAAPGGGIMGITSRSEKQPIKIGNFLDSEKDFEGKNKYSEWIFFYNPTTTKIQQGPKN